MKEYHEASYRNKGICRMWF